MPGHNIKRFVKHVAKAVKRQPSDVQSSLKDLRHMLDQSLLNEQLILDSDKEIIQEVNDSESVFVDKIRHLESELKKTEALRDEELSSSKVQISNLQHEISDLKARISDFIDSRTERERRFKELESRIKSKVMKNYDEIVLIEEQIKQLVARYDKIKNSEVYDKSLLLKLEDKIDFLKQKLLMRKAGISDVPKVKFLDFRPSSKPLVRHDLAISPHVFPSSPYHGKRVRLASWSDLESSEPRSVFSKFARKRRRH